MIPDEDNLMLDKLWRAAAGETPGGALDARILRAARAQARRRFLMPGGALLAACLMLTFFHLRQPLTPDIVTVPDTYHFGLTEGRELYEVKTESKKQKLIRQQPGGSLYAEIIP